MKTIARGYMKTASGAKYYDHIGKQMEQLEREYDRLAEKLKSDKLSVSEIRLILLKSATNRKKWKLVTDELSMLTQLEQFLHFKQGVKI